MNNVIMKSALDSVSMLEQFYVFIISVFFFLTLSPRKK